MVDPLEHSLQVDSVLGSQRAIQVHSLARLFWGPAFPPLTSDPVLKNWSWAEQYISPNRRGNAHNSAREETPPRRFLFFPWRLSMRPTQWHRFLLLVSLQTSKVPRILATRTLARKRPDIGRRFQHARQTIVQFLAGRFAWAAAAEHDAWPGKGLILWMHEDLHHQDTLQR